MQPTNYRYPVLFPPQVNGYGLNFGMSMHSDGAQDFASLPPLLNILSGGGGGAGFGVGSEHDQNSTDVLDGSGSNPNISRG